MAEQGTNEDSGGGAPPESRERLHALLLQFNRTLLAFKLYAPSNQLRQEMFGELMRRSDALFELEEQVVVEIEPNTLLWFGEPVLDLKEQEHSFIATLYRDGARQIGLTEGLDSGEMRALLEILQVRPLGLDPSFSVVDALWEADFQHVVHLAVDGFTEMLEDESGGAGSLATRFEHVLVDLVGRPATERRGPEAGRIHAPEPLNLPEEPSSEGDLIRISEGIASPLKALLEHPPAGLDQALAAWVKEVEEEREEDLLLSIEDLVVYWLEHPKAPFSDDEFVGLLTRLTRRWLTRGNFAVAGELLTRLEHLRFELPERRAVAEAVLAETGGRALRELVEAEELEETVWDLADAVRFFERHMAVTDDELYELANLELAPRGRRLLGHMLTQRVAQRPTVWASRFETLAAPLATVSLASLATVYDAEPGVLDVFHHALSHAESSVRLTALRTYPGPYDESVRDMLLPQLESAEVDVRRAAIERLGESGDGGLGPFLINRMRRVGLAELHPDEAEALTLAILRLGANRYTPFIRGQIEALNYDRGHQPKEGAEQLRAVLGALATTRQPAPIELLRDVRLKVRGDLREWCDELWRTVVSDWLASVGSGETEIPPEPSTVQPLEPGPEPARPLVTAPAPGPPKAPPIAGLRNLPDESFDDVEAFDPELVILPERDETDEEGA